MTAFYNEIDPFAAAWLRSLIAAGHIAPGVVDERSITELDPDELKRYTQVHLFAGIGGWSHALRLAGWPDSRPVWTGSCPCQPFSSAGKQKGGADDRHLWPHMFRLLRVCRPDVCFGEQVEGAVGHGWLDGVSADLEGEGYAVGAVVLGAHSVAAPHIRQRLWWVADAGYDVHEGGRQGRGLETAERGESGVNAEPGGVAGRLADGNGERLSIGEKSNVRQVESQQQTSRRNHPGGCRNACGVGAPQRDGLRVGRRPATNLPDQPGFWDAFDLVPCRDGKARRIEPGLEPLAHGVSGRVAVRLPGEQAGSAVSEGEGLHWYSRVGALKGFGNAIIPQVAAEFVTAYLETQPERRAAV